MPRYPGEHRLVLQFGQRETVGHLSQDVREGGAERRADRGEQFGGCLFLPALNLGQVPQ